MFSVPTSRIAKMATSLPSEARRFGKPEAGLRRRLYNVIFESDTHAGRLFDQILIYTVLLSIFVVILDSVPSIAARYGTLFNVLEWGFTLLFSVEYLARLYCVRRPLRYATSFFGIIDLLSVLPTYLALIVPEAHLFIDVRVLRLLRIFRVFKLMGFVSEYQALGKALAASRRKILVFLSFVLMIVLITATVMLVVEGPQHGFTSIPTAMYWAISTITTVGFGDITPKTDLGRFLASVIMLLGWGVLAVPTGIVTAEMTVQRRDEKSAARECAECEATGLAPEAKYCHRCGANLSAS
jgi:voltage-gated potassium channel